jgi:hypothetical protein
MVAILRDRTGATQKSIGRLRSTGLKKKKIVLP